MILGPFLSRVKVRDGSGKLGGSSVWRRLCNFLPLPEVPVILPRSKWGKCWKGSRRLHLKSVPRPMGDAGAVRTLIGGLVVARHRCHGTPGEIVVQHLSQRSVVGHSDIGQSRVEAGDRAAIHFIVLSVPAVYFDDGSLVAIGVGICRRPAECLSPVSSEPLAMLGMKAVAERMGDHLIGHHPTVPGVGKTAQPVHATRRL